MSKVPTVEDRLKNIERALQLIVAASYGVDLMDANVGQEYVGEGLRELALRAVDEAYYLSQVDAEILKAPAPVGDERDEMEAGAAR